MQQTPLFDRTPEQNKQNPSDPIYTVSQINAELKTLVEATYPFVWVEGEISDLKQPGSGHFYFNLKDSKSVIKAVMWKSAHRFMRWHPKNGMKVMVRGRVTVYEPQGCYQIDVAQMVPHGKGDLFAAFEQLKEKLQADGLFDKARKRPIPMLPKKIGIVTSPTGAAIQDMLHVLNRRFANLHILLFPAIVQGDEAAQTIAEGIRVLNLSKQIDVIIVARGGGSIEDLWPFNEEIVALAIYNSRIPVISAVGHETDTTIADFVADLRAPTPSAAAEIVIGQKSEFAERVRNYSKRIHQSLQSRILYLRNRMNVAAQHRSLAGFPQQLRTQQQMVDDFEGRLRIGLTRYYQIQHRKLMSAEQKMSPGQLRHLIEVKRSRMNGLTGRLRVSYQNKIHAVHRTMERFDAKITSLSPLAVLERGYSIACKEDGTILKNSIQTVSGERIQVKLHHGQLQCDVKEIKND